MRDGKVYDFVKVSKKEWKYVLEGRNIVKAKLSTPTSNDITITWIESASEGKDLLETMCKVYGMHLVKARTAVLAYYHR